MSNPQQNSKTRQLYIEKGIIRPNAFPTEPFNCAVCGTGCTRLVGYTANILCESQECRNELRAREQAKRGEKAAHRGEAA